MTTNRVTKSQKKKRLEWAMKKIDQGVGFSELASLVAETWGCSRRNARRVVSEAHKEWMEIAFGDDTSISLTCCSSASLVWCARRGRRRRLATSPV